MLAAEHPNEVRGVSVAHALGDQLDPLVRMHEQPPCFGHTARDDPPTDTSPRRLLQRSGEVGRAALHRSRHVTRSDAPKAMALDVPQGIDDHTSPRSSCAPTACRRALHFGKNEREQTSLNDLVRVASLQSIELAKQRLEKGTAVTGNLNHRGGSIAHPFERSKQ